MKVAVYTPHEYMFGGLRAGAKGYLLKDTSPEDLVSAIKKASRGETVLGSAVASRLGAELVQSPARSVDDDEVASEVLSPREAEVAKLVGNGATHAEIGANPSVTQSAATLTASDEEIPFVGNSDRPRPPGMTDGGGASCEVARSVPERGVRVWPALGPLARWRGRSACGCGARG
jgi:hypothetical protein